MESPASTASAAPSPGAAPGPSSEDAAALLASSFFPAPPTAHPRFTPRNLELARLLVAANPEASSSWRQEEQDAQLSCLGCDERPDFNLRELVEPPRVDWIIEQGGWDAFADSWPIDEHLPTLDEMGVQQLYVASDGAPLARPRRSAPSTEQTDLVDVMLKPPPSLSAEAMKDYDPENPEPTEAQQLIQHIRIACINMHHLCNELRPVQARETLQEMMKQQIGRRKARTQQLRHKVSDVLAALRSKYDVANTMDVDMQKDDVEDQRSHNPAPGDEADWRRVVQAVHDLP